MNHSPIKVGDRVRINTQSVWRNAFAVVTKVYQYSNGQGGYFWAYEVRLIQPTRRPSYSDGEWGILIPQRTLDLLTFPDVMLVRVP